jgi:N-methylhydantoinase B/oxoprolinase/acetone carboxylase alpha subunit
VVLEEFSIRRGSGGNGFYDGGNGAVRRIRFRQPMTAVVVASRRVVAPFGIEGGQDGQPGLQWVERHSGGRVELSGTAHIDLAPGDVLGIATPGGGGYGRADDRPTRHDQAAWRRIQASESVPATVHVATAEQEQSA